MMMMVMAMVVGGNNQFIAQKEGRGSLGSNGMNNGGVGIERDGEIYSVEKETVDNSKRCDVVRYVRSHGERKWNAVQKNPPKSKTPFKDK
ncbi:hypothetical protein GOBAR_AA01603 [Gossypium barbadense]|uniref:Uncharacterized protein n=1 Tax=Gossypium barbadense TaxID=3634 RepID=A0A2P5YTM9_GOSBA|nr:hypothetical protein GOBAR_AA01603 [Gossypium barbadense]